MTPKATPPLRAWLCAVGRLDAQHRQWIALPVAAFALLAPPGRSALLDRLPLAWDVYASALLALMWTTLLTHDPAHALRLTRLEDSSRVAIFGSVLVAACMSLFAVLFTLFGHPSAPPVERTADLARTVVTVFISWALIHTLFAIHYAHVFHRRKAAAHSKNGGLQIPGDTAPDYLDFAYFSFTLGMTFQTSDIAITSAEMRRLALVHGVIAFIYSTTIVALLVNILGSLGKA